MPTPTPTPAEVNKHSKLKRVTHPTEADSKSSKRGRLGPELSREEIEANLSAWFDKYALDPVPGPGWANHKDVWDQLRQGEQHLRAAGLADWFVRIEGVDLNYMLDFAKGRIARDLNDKRKAVQPRGLKLHKFRRPPLSCNGKDDFNERDAQLKDRDAVKAAAKAKADTEAEAVAAAAAKVAQEAARIAAEEEARRKRAVEQAEKEKLEEKDRQRSQAEEKRRREAAERARREEQQRAEAEAEATAAAAAAAVVVAEEARRKREEEEAAEDRQRLEVEERARLEKEEKDRGEEEERLRREEQERVEAEEERVRREEEAAKVAAEDEVDELEDDSDQEVHNALTSSARPPTPAATLATKSPSTTPAPAGPVAAGPVASTSEPALPNRVATVIAVPTAPPLAAQSPPPKAPSNPIETITLDTSPPATPTSHPEPPSPSPSPQPAAAHSPSPSPVPVRLRSPLPTASPPGSLQSPPPAPTALAGAALTDGGQDEEVIQMGVDEPADEAGMGQTSGVEEAAPAALQGAEVERVTSPTIKGETREPTPAQEPMDEENAVLPAGPVPESDDGDAVRAPPSEREGSLLPKAGAELDDVHASQSEPSLVLEDVVIEAEVGVSPTPRPGTAQSADPTEPGPASPLGSTPALAPETATIDGAAVTQLELSPTPAALTAAPGSIASPDAEPPTAGPVDSTDPPPASVLAATSTPAPETATAPVKSPLTTPSSTLPQPSVSPTASTAAPSAFPLRRRFAIPQPKAAGAAPPAPASAASTSAVVFGSGWKARPSAVKALSAPSPALRGSVHEAGQASGGQGLAQATPAPAGPVPPQHGGRGPPLSIATDSLARSASEQAQRPAGGQTHAQSARPLQPRPQPQLQAISTATSRPPGPSSAPARVANPMPMRPPGVDPTGRAPFHPSALGSVPSPNHQLQPPRLIGQAWPTPKPVGHPLRWLYNGRELKLGLVEALWNLVDGYGGGGPRAMQAMAAYAATVNIYYFTNQAGTEVNADVAGMFEEVIRNYQGVKRTQQAQAQEEARAAQVAQQQQQHHQHQQWLVQQMNQARQAQAGLARSQPPSGPSTGAGMVQPYGRPDQNGHVYQPSEAHPQQPPSSSRSAQPPPIQYSNVPNGLSQSLNGPPAAPPRPQASSHQRAGSLPNVLLSAGPVPGSMGPESHQASSFPSPAASASAQASTSAPTSAPAADAAAGQQERVQRARELLRAAVPAVQRLMQLAAGFGGIGNHVVATGAGAQGQTAAGGARPMEVITIEDDE